MKKKSSRGGHRPGSGRPPKHGKRLVKFGIRVLPDQAEFLRSRGGISDFIIKLISDSPEFKAWMKRKS